MFFRQLLNDTSSCASYLLGCKSKARFAVVDPHADLVDRYVSLADAQGIPIVAAASQGPKELICHGEDGVLVPVDDPEALAREVRRLIDHPARQANPP